MFLVQGLFNYSVPCARFVEIIREWNRTIDLRDSTFVCDMSRIHPGDGIVGRLHLPKRNTLVELAYRLSGLCGELRTGIDEPSDTIFLKSGVVAASKKRAVTACAKLACAYLGSFRVCGWLVG